MNRSFRVVPLLVAVVAISFACQHLCVTNSTSPHPNKSGDRQFATERESAMTIDQSTEAEAAAALRQLIADYATWQQFADAPSMDNAPPDNRPRLWMTTVDDQRRKYERLETLNDISTSINSSLLSPIEADTLTLLRNEISLIALSYEDQWYLRPLSGNPYTVLLHVYRQVNPYELSHFDVYLTTLGEIPAYFDNLTSTLKAGMEAGIVTPRPALITSPSRLAELRAEAVMKLQYPFAWGWEKFPQLQGPTYWGRYQREILPAINTALDTFDQFLLTEYIPAAGIRLSHVRGAHHESYDRRLRLIMTIDVKATELHERGLCEVTSLHNQISKYVRTAGVQLFLPNTDSDISDDELCGALVNHMRTADEFYSDDSEALLEEYRAYGKEVNNILPKYFATLPKLKCEIHADDHSSMGPNLSAKYVRGSLEPSVPSVAYFNVENINLHPMWFRKALLYHEAMPGHHIEQALSEERLDFPLFRRRLYLPIYSEGWAMYAEQLAREAGLYVTHWEVLGSYYSELLRACRMVVDTGIHGRGWSMEESLKFLEQRLPFTRDFLEQEVTRVAVWPGQGVSYTAGLNAILDERERAMNSLGTDFDIREFHKVILSNGPVTIPMLNRNVSQWIKK